MARRIDSTESAEIRRGLPLGELLWIGLIALLPLVFGPFLNDTFALPKVTLLRVGCLLIFIATAFKILKTRQLPFRPSPWNLPCVLLLAVSLLSAWNSDFQAVGFWGLHGFYTDGWTSLACFLFLFWFVSSRLPESALPKMAGAMLGAGLIVSIYALLQASGFDPFIWRSGQAVFGRPWSTLGNANYLGAYLALTLPIGCGCLLQKPTTLRVFSVALMLAALPFTSSQAAWLGAAAGLGVWSLWEWTTIRRRFNPIAAAALLGVALCVGISVWRAHYRPQKQSIHSLLAQNIAAPLSPSGSALLGRFIMWRAALRIWRHHPLVGSGPDSFVYEFKREMDPRFEEAMGRGVSSAYAHNSALNMAATLGTLGAAVYLWLGVVFLRSALQLWRLRRPDAAFPRGSARSAAFPPGAVVASLVAVWLNNQFSFHSVTTAAYCWILIGVMARFSSPRQSLFPIPWSSSVIATLRLATFALGAAGLLLSVSFLCANRYYRLAEDAFRKQRDWRAAIPWSEKAVFLNPFYSGHRIRLARMLQEGILRGKNNEERKHYLEESIRQYQIQVGKTPRHAPAQRGLGVSLMQGGILLKDPQYWADAEGRFRSALEADPHMTEAFSDLGNCLYLQGKKQEAIAVYRRAISRKPKAASLHLGLGNLHAFAGEQENAVREWQNTLRLDPDNPQAKERLIRLWREQEAE